MDSVEVTFSPRKLWPFFELGKQAGCDVEGILGAHGRTESEMRNPDTRLPRALCLRMVKDVLAVLRDPLAGLGAAECFVLEDLDLLGYIARQCPDVVEALRTISGYAPLVGDTSRASVTVSNGELTLTQWIAGDAPLEPIFADYLIASSYRGVCALAGADLAPLRVALARPRPPNVEAYRRFFSAPVVFGVERGALVYSESVLRAIRLSGDARLAELLTRQADSRVTRSSPEATVPERARSELRRLMELGPPSLSALASGLSMSERTLRRRLERAKTSYRQLVDELRREHALSAVDAGEVRVTEVALRLGFTDVTAFARAFRRWTGVSPTDYMRRKRSAPQVPSAAAYKPPSTVG